MKLILITLVAVVVGMMVACASTPAAPAASSGPMLSEAEAIAVVRYHMALKNLPALNSDGTFNCGASLDAREKLTANRRKGTEWVARYSGDGVWKVQASYEERYSERHPWEIDTYTWDMYEKTESVVNTSKYRC